MWRLLPLLLIGVAGLSSPAEAGNPDKKLKYDATRPLLTLHTAPTRQHSLSALDPLLRASGDSAAPMPVVIYVHGRGEEPRKSFADSIFGSFGFGWGKGRLLEKIEQYGVNVVGFNWQSEADGWCDRPIALAEQSAASLVDLTAALGEHRAAHPDFWRDRPLTLLVHSMGSFVVARATLDERFAGVTVFDRVIITASDATAQTHAGWLSRIPVRADRIVVSNASDKTLKRSREKCESNGPLRLGQLEAQMSTIHRDPSSIYVEVSVGKRHRYFTKGGQDGNTHICRLFQDTFAGRPLPLDPAWRTAANVYRLPPPGPVGAACTAGAIADDDSE
jgi:hypothetical protein